MLFAGNTLQSQSKADRYIFLLVYHEKYSEKMKLYKDVLELVMILIGTE